MKSEKTLKTTIFHWVTVSKPLGQNWIMRYLWKDNIHIFNLTPSGPIYPQYFCHTEPFYKQGPTKKWENGELSVHIFSCPWYSTTLQSMMNAKLSKQRFWHCYENRLIKTIQTIPHNLYVSVKLTSLYCGLRLILVYPKPQLREADSETFDTTFFDTDTILILCRSECEVLVS